MNCIIVDDVSSDRAAIERFCLRSELFDSVEAFEEPTRAIKYLRENVVDLVFLDVHMPKLSGYDFLNTLYYPPAVIFISNDDTNAPKAFDFDAIDFLLKPISYKRFLQAVQRAADHKRSKMATINPVTDQNELFVKEGSQYVKLDVDQIRYIEALGDYVKFVTSEGEHVVHSTMKKTLENLPDKSFMKVHRSFIINVNFIHDVRKNEIDLGGIKVPVSKANRDALKKKLNF